MNQKVQTVFHVLSAKYLDWSKWFLSIFLLLFLILKSSFSYFNLSDYVVVLEAATNSTRIFFFVMGIMSMGKALEYYLSQGVTRKDYFIGNMLTLSLLSFGFVLVISGLYVVEQSILSWEGFETLPALLSYLTGIWFQLMIYYLVGWLISAGFYRFHWLIGMLYIVLGILYISILDSTWGVESSPSPVVWLGMLGEQSTLLAAGIGLLLIATLLLIIRLTSRNVAIKA